MIEGVDYKKIPLSTTVPIDIDFDQINEFIRNQIDQQKGPVLLFCKDGNKISPGFAISYLMHQKKGSLQIASLKVFHNKGGIVDISKWLYSLLMLYDNVKK